MKFEKIFADAGYHSAFMTTFRFDPTIFDDLIRPRLRSNGCRNIAVLADQDMLNASFAEMGPPVFAGTRYHIAKRSVRGAFHPKILLQLGEDIGRLFVGSANLTGAGLQGNLEIVEWIDVTAEDRRAAPLLAAAFAYIKDHANPADEAFTQALVQAWSETPWLRRTEARNRVEAVSGIVELLMEAEGQTIGDRFIDAVGGRRVSRLLCSAPYWDEKLTAVSALQTALSPEATALVVAPEAQDFNVEAFEALTGASLHSSEHLPGIKERIYHAKVLVAETDEGDVVLTGSANMSMAALFRERGRGNAEACILRHEAPGTALARLGFDACLSKYMPTGALQPRRRERDNAAGSEPKLLDGGAVFLSGAELEWHPPSGSVDLSSCRLHIFDESGERICLVKPKEANGRIWLLGDFDVEMAANVTAQIKDKMCAPMIIARLARLRHHSRPPVKGSGKALLAALEGRSALDAELCGLLRQFMEEVSEPEKGEMGLRKSKDGASGDKKGENEDEDNFIGTDAFGSLSPETAAAKVSDAAMRSIFDAIAMILKRVNPSEPRHLGSDSGGNTSSSRLAAPKRSPEWRRKQFDQLLSTIQDCYRERALDPLSITSVTMVRCFIEALSKDGDSLFTPETEDKENEVESEKNVIAECEDDEGNENKKKAYGPLEPSGGWARMIGRCVKAFVDALPEKLSETDIQDEQIYLFADIQAAADLVFRTAQHKQIKILVESMGTVLAALALRLQPALKAHRGKEELMRIEVHRSAQKLERLWDGTGDENLRN